MSMMLMVKAMNTKVGNPLRKLILIKLADNANDKGECWPSHQHIADLCEVSKSTVRKHIKELCESGLLSVTHRDGPKGNTSNLYHLTIHPVPSKNIGMPSGDTPPMPSDGTRTSHSLEPVKEPVTLPRRVKRYLPDDFVVTDDMKAWAIKNRLAIDINNSTDRWKDSMLAGGYKYTDWTAAWRNGMKNAQKWLEEKTPQPQTSGYKPARGFGE